MKLLPSVDYASLEAVDAVVATLSFQLDFLLDETLKSSWSEDDYGRLRTNILFMKQGFERAERICLDDESRTAPCVRVD